MNRTIKGVVIKEQPSGEKGKLLYILTENDGILPVNATGARTISASYLKSVQIFAYSDLTVYEKNGHYTLTEATLIDNFYGIRNDVVAFACASYMSELCLLVTVPQDDGIMRLYLNCLFALSKSLADADKVKAVFEYRLCGALGLAPDFSCCAICEDEGSLFDFEETALFCTECAPNPESSFPLVPDAVKSLNYLNVCPPNRILSFTVNGSAKQYFCEFCEKYLLYSADIIPKSLDTYKSIRKDM